MMMRYACERMCGVLSIAGWAAATRPATCSHEESEALAAPSKRVGSNEQISSIA